MDYPTPAHASVGTIEALEEAELAFVQGRSRGDDGGTAVQEVSDDCRRNGSLAGPSDHGNVVLPGTCIP